MCEIIKRILEGICQCIDNFGNGKNSYPDFQKLLKNLTPVIEWHLSDLLNLQNGDRLN